MNVYFLFKNYNLKKCGISDYIEYLTFELNKYKFNPIILSNKSLNCKNQSSRFLNVISWNFFSILKYFKTHQNGIFFLQYSPFNFSNSGFSLSLILLLFYLKIFKKKIKLFINFHEIRNKFSFIPKYFLIYCLHTLQFYVIYFLSKKNYYTNKDFTKDLPILKKKKNEFLKIFSTIEWNNIKKKNQIIFFSSHFNYQKFKKFFEFIKLYQHKYDKKFNIIFLGNANKDKFIKLKQLLKMYNLKNAKIILNLTKKKLSFILCKNKIVMVTNNENYKINSSFIVSSIKTRNCLFFLNKKKFKNEVKNNFHSVHNQKIFIKKINNILSKKDSFFKYKIFFLRDYEVKCVVKKFISSFNQN